MGGGGGGGGHGWMRIAYRQAVELLPSARHRHSSRRAPRGCSKSEFCRSQGELAATAGGPDHKCALPYQGGSLTRWTRAMQGARVGARAARWGRQAPEGAAGEHWPMRASSRTRPCRQWADGRRSAAAGARRRSGASGEAPCSLHPRACTTLAFGGRCSALPASRPTQNSLCLPNCSQASSRASLPTLNAPAASSE